MTPAEIIQDVLSHGGKVTIDGADLTLTAPQPLPADLLQEVCAHKAELIRYVNMQAANSDPAERRRIEVLSMLAQGPSVTHAFVTRRSSGVGLCGCDARHPKLGTCELRISKDRYDSLAVLDLIQEYTNGALEAKH